MPEKNIKQNVSRETLSKIQKIGLFIKFIKKSLKFYKKH